MKHQTITTKKQVTPPKKKSTVLATSTIENLNEDEKTSWVQSYDQIMKNWNQWCSWYWVPLTISQKMWMQCWPSPGFQKDER